MEPITLSADVWSLGVLTYVLLTGFSPFGGDTDQETLRNITSANLDFPQELFEGVSDMAKDFITQCLNRNPRERPTVQDLLQHPLLAEEEEPPSPSPLMLKIPASPDHYSVLNKNGHHGPSGPASPTHRHHYMQNTQSSNSSSSSASLLPHSSRRSCTTCRNNLTERKRYLSKSREAIFEKVSRNSNLKKSLSKSRERLCDMRLTISKSRESLNNGHNWSICASIESTSKMPPDLPASSGNSNNSSTNSLNSSLN